MGAIARKNKRRRLNQQKLKNSNDIVINTQTSMKQMDDDLVSSDSSSSSYDAIIFENNDKIDAEMIALDSSDDEQDELKKNEKIKIKQSQIEKLIRIPKSIKNAMNCLFWRHLSNNKILQKREQNAQFYKL